MSEHKPLFVSADEKEQAYHDGQVIIHKTTGGNTFRNVSQPNISVREGYDRRDYDFFRPGEAIPTRDIDIIGACMQSYDRIGIVRNTIDMMSEFACQGIDLVHPNPRIEKFFKEWFNKINGKERTERILNMLFRAANVIIKRSTARISDGDAAAIQKGQAADMVADISKPPKPMEIPWEYTIFNPLSIDVYGAELAPFIGTKHFRYGVRVSEVISKKLKKPQASIETDMLTRVPKEVMDLARKGGKLIPLPAEKTIALYYKRDDWQVWARPMTYSILEDLIMLRKMKLADISALDGAVSHIRLWKLGSLEHRILPTEAAIARLADMLMNNVGGGSIDLIWGPELQLQETSTDISKFLGEEKYRPILNSIFAGLGIPPGLTGLPSPQGFGNNFVSLSTLIERLQYGRDILARFWANEIRIVQQAMGFRLPAQVVFDQNTLTDEAALQRLLIDLSDRGLISDEALQERFSLVPEIERVRVRRESRMRKDGNMPFRPGPFTTDTTESVKKIFAQMGQMSPSDFGIDPATSIPKEQSSSPLPGAPTEEKPKGQPGQGRPDGSADTQPRKRREMRPSQAEYAEAFVWADSAHKKISELTHPAYLKSIGKKNLREASSEEIVALESFRFAVLAQFTVGDEITEERVREILRSDIKTPPPLQALYKETVSRFISRQGASPSAEERRRLEASVYAVYATL
jgi:hypothetical protein